MIRMLDTLWLLRTGADGGTEYVCFRGSADPIEMIEAYHLPPQMPLLKKRRWLNQSEAISCRRRLESSEGFRHGTPLF
jgi:hypothetical protein